MVLLFFLVALVVCYVRADPPFIPYDTIMTQLRSYPYNATVAQHTLAQLHKAYKLYPFLQIASNPPDPAHFSPPVDLEKSFKALAKMPFESDFLFQEALKAVFLQLHDAHTAYWPPQEYRYKFIQPLNFVTYLAGGTRMFEVVNQWYPGLVSYYGSTLGIDLRAYVGAKLLAIDGNDPFSYFQSFAKTSISTSKDVQTRFNLALYMPDVWDAGANLGYWSVRWWRHHGMAVPLKKTHSYKLLLQNSSTVTVSFDWVAQFADSGPLPHPQKKWNRSLVPGRRTPKNNVWLEQHQQQEPQIVPILNSSAGGVAFYQLDNRTMVWQQNTFEPNDLAAYYQTAIDALLYAQLNGLDRLILDMSNNGGGDLCLGRAMLKLLYPMSPNVGPTDMPLCALSQTLAQYAATNNVRDTEWSASFYANLAGVRFNNNDTSWLIPGVTRQRGGVACSYSQLIDISGEEEGDQLGGCGESPFGLLKPYSPDRIVLVTRGLCGSTCALFSDVLARFDGVRTVVLGGVDSSIPQSYRSFPGLQVMDSDSLYQVFDMLGQNTSDQTCTECVAPRRLLNSAQYRMCIREIYRDQDTLEVPSEYLFQPADYHLALDRDSALNVAGSAWAYVAANILGNDRAWAQQK